MTRKHKLIAIVGPSATGKSNLAVQLAHKIHGEIVSADSRLVYREFNIATAKPDIKEQQSIKHHLIDVINPDEEYTVANFADDAKAAIEEIVEKKKIPIVVGGTGLYFRILLENFDLPRVPPNKELREKLEKQSEEELYSMLESLDSEIAQKIHKNNKVKMIRAIEVAQTLNTPMSIAQKTKENDYDVLWIGLNAKNRDFVYERINLRVEKMFKDGLWDEARRLFNKYPNLDLLMNTIGYQELKPHFDGLITLEEAKENIKQNTRRYAKRQLSWFRANKQINWFNIDEMQNEKIINSVLKLWNAFN